MEPKLIRSQVVYGGKIIYRGGKKEGDIIVGRRRRSVSFVNPDEIEIESPLNRQ